MYDSFLQELVQINFLPLCIIVFLIIFIGFNDAYEHEVTTMFVRPMFFLIVLIIIDNVDYYLLEGRNVGFIHVLSAFLGYNVRICLMLSLIYIEIREESKKIKRILLIPAFINLLITFLAFFTKLVFWYGENGEIMRGPLSFTPHVISLLYSVVLFGYGIYILRYDRWRETVVVCLATAFSLLGTLVETLFQLRGILIGVVSLDVAFFYMYMHVEYFKLDILTGANNRVSFYADTRKLDFKGDISVFSIDLNDLKKINDTKGHLAGDEAIRSAAKLIRKCLLRGAHLYRIGGDEFVIVCFGIPEEKVKNMESRLKVEMLGSKYSFAIGRATMETGEKFDDVYIRADREMYKNKREMKGERRKSVSRTF
ncbi:MAG: GGDEF domain-containing protein [Lachnospiraceae bacterium]|nr:GGDEF domain-containing protein [Lachnospiraceae bacterium]